MNIPGIRPSAIICAGCGGQAADPATEAHAGHVEGCTALAAFGEAMAAARRLESEVTWSLAVMAAQQGTGAVATAAFIPGGPTVEDLQRHYEALQAQTRTMPPRAA